MPIQKQCIFCDIISGESKSEIIYQDEKNICFIPLEQETFGHCLIVPKRHFENLNDIDNENLFSLMNFLQNIKNLYKEKLKSDNFNILMANGIEAQQSINHLHIHYIPRFAGDGINAWPDFENTRDISREDFLIKIRSGI